METAPVQHTTTLSGHTERVWQVCWSSDGTLLASCSADRTVRVWQYDNSSGGGGDWRCLAVLTDAHERTVRAVAFSPCGRWLASASFDGSTCVWDRRHKWQCVATLEGHESEVKSVGWAPSGRFLATCSRDKSVWVWELLDPSPASAAAGDQQAASTVGAGDAPDMECAAVMMSHTQDVKCVAWSPRCDELASCSYDDTVCVYAADDDDGEWTTHATLRGHTSTVWCVAWGGDGHSLASASDDGNVRVWRRPAGGSNSSSFEPPAQWTCACVLSGHHSRAVYSVAWLGGAVSADNGDAQTDEFDGRGVLATACGDNALRLFVETSGGDGGGGCQFDAAAVVREAHSQDVNCVSWRPGRGDAGGEMLATAGDDCVVKVWRLNLQDVM